MTNLSDQTQRELALNIQQSYIVQAPAGSGKTELLMQRYLALLAHARAPEEIIAITFTRKAATEMRHRILSALEFAAQNEQPPALAHQAKTWQLARQVINHAQLNNWAILDNPNYLRIQTIDSFCASLTRQMPILSRFGTQPLITEDANILYRAAAKAMLSSLEEDNYWTPYLIKLLLHLDNDFSKVENLLSTMLEKRDQWLTYLAHRHDPIYLRELLQQGLKNVIDENLFQLEQCISQHLKQELKELLAFSQEQLELSSTKASASTDYTNTNNLWQAFVRLLLTDTNTWRKAINKSNGFPTAKEAKDNAEKLRFAEMKKRMEAVLAECAEHHTFLQLLIDLKNLPPEKYNEKQWEIILALLELLPLAVAQLQLLFKEKGEVDYIEIAQSALQALGDAQTPTDLALALDYKIQHLLIDEFQDTSIAQFRLIEQLTAGWQPDDGRTLFLVGDPMQSIYRFRKAEVGLFIKAREQGIGSVKLDSLVLTVNFRSTPIIIDWINNVFRNVMPAKDDVASGAISFTPSDAGKTDIHNTHSEICYYWLNETQNEAQIITQLVKQILETNPQQKIAILVRARMHIIPILNQLKKHNIDYRAVEIETLQQKIIIQDLLALTRALLHPADRIAWLAILRAPWCGLTLTELHQLTRNKEKTLWENLQAYQTLNFSSESQQRIQRFINAISPSFKTP